MRKRTRPNHRAPDGKQRGFHFEAESLGPSPSSGAEARFEAPSPSSVFVNGIRLFDYLMQVDRPLALHVHETLLDFEWTSFLEEYRPGGRPPIHPRIVVGLLVYGLLQGHSSLRELESLARIDLGAWYLCGGLQPDHSTLGKFLQRHQAVLSDEFFEAMTRQLVQKLALRRGVAAMDGTVMAAAASRLKTLKAEAAQRAAQEAQAAAEAQPASEEARASAEAAKQLAEIAASRGTEREAKHPDRPKDQLVIVPGELDAVVQPLKEGGHRPAYKPSVMVHESGLIVGQQVHPTSETAVVPEMRRQHEQIFEGPPTTTLADAGYCATEILSSYVEANEDLLVPSGRTDANLVRKGRKGLFGKADFTYDEATDSFRCRGGHVLFRQGKAHPDRNGRLYVSYQPRVGDCRACPLRAQCTKAKTGPRSVARYEGDEYKEAMQLVLTQPGARKIYKLRGVLAEPIFAALKERQGLRRFRRRGLVKVRMEFALHCVAFNIGRAISLKVRRAVVLVLWGRLPGLDWHPLAIRVA